MRSNFGVCAALSLGGAVGLVTCVATAEPPSEVVVQGDAVRDPIPTKDRGVAGSMIARDQLVGPGLEAQDVLRTQPGVTVSESGGFGAPATAAIRGATAADTPVYLGGVRLNDDVAGTADLSLVPLWLIDRVEVYRGNAPIEADRLGPGGAIFFTPRRPTDDGGGVGYYGGSWGASKGWGYQSIHASKVDALLGASADHATNRYPFLNDHGTLLNGSAATADRRSNGDESTVDGWGLARVQLGAGSTLDVLANGISREQGVPSLALLPTKRARSRSERALASVGVHVPLSRQSVVDSRTSLIVGSTSYDDPLLELDLSTNSLTVTGTRVEESLGATLAVGDWLRLRPVFNLAHEQIHRQPNDIPLAHAHREFGRVAVGAASAPIGPLELHALLSAECHHTGAKADSTCDVFEPTGRLGAELATGPWRWLGNLGRYVRVPTLGEMYGVASTVHGNPNLSPESGYTADTGIRLKIKRQGLFGGAFLDAFVFAHWADGLIAYERTAQGYVVPYNVGRARVVGAELLASVALWSTLRAEVSGTALDPRDTSPERTTVNDVLPYRSRFVTSPRLRFDWKQQNHNGVSAVGGQVQALYQSSRYADPAGLGVINQQTTVDIEAYVAWFDGLLTARGRVADLADARRTDIIGYPLPGRTAYFGLEATW